MLWKPAPRVLPCYVAPVTHWKKGLQGPPPQKNGWLVLKSLEVGAGPAKAPIATAHLGEACKHTHGLSTCIVVYKASLYPLSRTRSGLLLSYAPDFVCVQISHRQVKQEY